MVLAIKVPVKKGESIRRYLMEKGLLNTDYKIKSSADYLLIPINDKDPHLDSYEYLDVELKPQPKREHLDFTKIYGRRAFDLIGDIAILDIPEDKRDQEKEIGESLLKIHKNVKTVVAKETAVKNVYRVRKVRYLAGEDKRETIHHEHGCRFYVNVEEEYFSPRLSFERGRIADLVKDGENVLVLFAGVAPFSIVIAKKKRVKVYSIELNPHAHKQAIRNVKINKLKGEVIPIEGDVREVLKEERFKEWADRVVMPLPWSALEFIPDVMNAIRKGGWMHVYAFIDKTKVQETIKKIEELTGNRGKVKNYRRVRVYSPEIEQYVFDVQIEK